MSSKEIVNNNIGLIWSPQILYYILADSSKGGIEKEDIGLKYYTYGDGTDAASVVDCNSDYQLPDNDVMEEPCIRRSKVNRAFVVW